MSVLNCTWRDNTRGKFQVEYPTAITLSVSSIELVNNIAPGASPMCMATFMGMNDKFEEWCRDHHVGIKHLYMGFVEIPTDFLERDVFYVVEFASTADAMLFKLSWL